MCLSWVGAKYSTFFNLPFPSEMLGSADASPVTVCVLPPPAQKAWDRPPYGEDNPHHTPGKNWREVPVVYSTQWSWYEHAYQRVRLLLPPLPPPPRHPFSHHPAEVQKTGVQRS